VYFEAAAADLSLFTLHVMQDDAAIVVDDRNAIKTHLVALIASMPPAIQRQVGDLLMLACGPV
jgi:hypothetical protein